MISAGDLRHRITIEKIQSSSQDSSGQDSSTYAPVATVWASIVPKKGSDMLLQQIGAVEPTTTFLITIRYPGFDIDKTIMRLNYQGVIYQITGATYPEMIKSEVEIEAVEDK